MASGETAELCDRPLHNGHCIPSGANHRSERVTAIELENRASSRGERLLDERERLFGRAPTVA